MNFREIRQSNIREMTKGYKACYLFGAGHYAQIFLDFAGDFAQEIFAGILVSNPNENPESVRDIPVFDVMKVNDNVADTLIVVLLKDNREVIKQLRNRGFGKVISMEQVLPLKEIVERAEDVRWNHEVNRYIHYFENVNPLFRYVEIETINRCNGVCSFCPVNVNALQRKYAKMESEMFFSIIDQLHDLDYTGQVALFSNNEPFLDNRIVDFARYARNKLPQAFLYIFTNGSLLSLEMFAEIIQYLDLLQFDNYLSDDMPENVREIENYCKTNGLLEKVYYSVISKDMVRESRGGESPNSRVYYTTEYTCSLPFVQMVIRPDGKVSLCCNDALGQMTMGDLHEQSLIDIWRNEDYRLIRGKIKEGRYGISVCRYCNHKGNRELWKNGAPDMKQVDWDNRIIPVMSQNPQFKEKEIYIFGIEREAIAFYWHLKEKGYVVNGFLENVDFLGRDTKEITDGKECTIITNILSNKENIVIYVVVPYGYAEVYRELQELGFEQIRLVI